MKCIRPLIATIFCLIIFFTAWAQKKNTIQPGKLYNSGEQLWAPRYGFKATIPDGWEGFLPRDTEMFLLKSVSDDSETFMYALEKGDLNTIKSNGVQGLKLNETITIKMVNPTIVDGMLSAEVIMEGENINKAYKGFIVSRCHTNGVCVSALLKSVKDNFEKSRKTVTQLMKEGSFEEPSNASPYADFDWKEFLSGKEMTAFDVAQGSSKETSVHFCGDETFTANVQKKGIFKNDTPAYKGKLRGHWSIVGKGEKAILKLSFDNEKLDELDMPISISEEKVYGNGDRYFVAESSKCK